MLSRDCAESLVARVCRSVPLASMARLASLCRYALLLQFCTVRVRVTVLAETRCRVKSGLCGCYSPATGITWF